MQLKSVLLCFLLTVVCFTYADKLSVELNCTEPNEHYECGSACQTTCGNLGKHCPIANFRCNDACYCDKGYARDDVGVCIPQEDCPSKDD